MKGVKAQAAKLALRGAERTTRFVQVGGENDPVIYGVARHAREQEISTLPADVDYELFRSAWGGGGRYVRRRGRGLVCYDTPRARA